MTDHLDRNQKDVDHQIKDKQNRKYPRHAAVIGREIKHLSKIHCKSEQITFYLSLYYKFLLGERRSKSKLFAVNSKYCSNIPSHDVMEKETRFAYYL